MYKRTIFRPFFLPVLLVVLLWPAASSALEVKATGQWIIESLWADNWQFGDPSGSAQPDFVQDYNVWQRFRTQFQFIANENLKAVVSTQIGTEAWGRNAFQMGESRSVIKLHRAYLDWTIPETDTEVQAGFMTRTMPNSVAGGYAVLNEELPAVVFDTQFNDAVGLTGGYLRPYQSGSANESSVDGLYATLPVTVGGWYVEPYAVGLRAGDGIAGADVTGSVNALGGMYAPGDTGAGDWTAWWGGAAFRVDAYTPWVFMGDVVYGAKQSDVDRNEMHGWFVDAALSYTGFDFVTPTLTLVWNSGEDGDLSNGSERMPQIVSDFDLGSFFFDGTNLVQGTMQSANPQAGFWAAMLTFGDISFSPGLTHTINVLYVRGTNDADLPGVRNWQYGRTLTEKDSLWEFDLNTALELYDELTVYLELGYINADFSEKVWGPGLDGGSAGKVDLGLVYSF